ncbi:DNA-binding response regulator [Melioribacter roseus P3M-2]|uniref:DNA-binding response regulator n=1 Tax=Melioribacter roseus (strain DSM 23840 / JCM 17771 / VKM B-2668 / P3M-2) TaxID=1191523 RepID=I7A3Y9_MELRP|nr:response regulator [Melioribacter roseus]AFN74616.1 DNA-binding response regulator [Melioribacter roseus P3M-2]
MEEQEVKKPRILIAEGDQDNRHFLTLYLKKYFSADTCDSAEGLYELLSQNDYDIILMDIALKGNKDGIQLIQELKNNEAYSQIPILCYTTFAMNRDRINALNAGCDMYLTKPTDIKTLLYYLFTLLKKKGKNFTAPVINGFAY